MLIYRVVALLPYKRELHPNSSKDAERKLIGLSEEGLDNPSSTAILIDHSVRPNRVIFETGEVWYIGGKAYIDDRDIPAGYATTPSWQEKSQKRLMQSYMIWRWTTKP